MASTVQEGFGSYDIQREVGRGGMGVVYLATDRRLGRRVALKVIVPELAADRQFRERFEREARVAATLEHPHVVPVYEAGEQDGSLFIAMRFVDGSDLASYVRGHGPLAPQRLARLIVQVAGALDAAHRAGVVHRDVKPANVLLTGAGEDEQAYLTDFGLTRDAASDSGLTVTGQWVGTVDYAAPEQIMGDPTDARSDVYALGCTVFHALTGAPQVPETPATTRAARTVDSPTAPTRPSPTADSPTTPTRPSPPVGSPADATLVADASPPARPGRARQPRILAALALILFVAAAAVVALLVGGGDDKAYADEASDAVAGLARANRALSDRYVALSAATPRATIQPASTAAATAQRGARRRVAALDAGGDRELAGKLTRALDAERAFLDEATKAAASPSSADPDAIEGTGSRMADAFAAVSGDVSGLAGVEGAPKLAAWVRGRQGGARVGVFVRNVDAVLGDARPGRRRISQVAGAIQDGSITPSDARSGIVEVVANREAALAAARALPAPDDATGDVKNKLVEAFRRSLDNDRDFQDGIAAYESGDFDRFATKVYDDAFASNDAATAAKKAFLGAYNALRAKRNLPPVADDF